MKKSIIVVTIMMLIVGIFFIGNKVYAAEERAIDNETESKIVELKDNALNSIQDYKEKYRIRCLWDSSVYFKFSSYL
jgi:peptidoglycan hydrolase CwlO-like protein